MILKRKTLKSLSYSEGIAYSLMVASTETYALIHFARLNQNPLSLGILAGLPQVIGSFLLYWAPAKIERHHLPLALFLSMAIQAFGVFILFLSASQGATLSANLLGLSLYWIGGMGTSSLWADWMAPKIGAAHFGEFIAKRNAITMLGQLVFFTGLAFVAESYLSYPDLFLLGLVARIVSMAIQLFLFKFQVEEEHVPFPQESRAPAITTGHLDDEKFLSFNFVTGIFRLTIGLCSTFFLPYMLYTLKLSTQDYVFLTAIPMLARAIFVTKWARSGQLAGHLFSLEVSAIGVALLPVMWNFGNHFSYIVFMQILSGIFWSGHDISTALLVQDLYHGRSRRPLGLLQATYTIAGLGGSFLGASMLTILPDYNFLFSLSTGFRLFAAGGMISYFNHFYGGTKFSPRKSALFLMSIFGRSSKVDERLK